MYASFYSQVQVSLHLKKRALLLIPVYHGMCTGSFFLICSLEDVLMGLELASNRVGVGSICKRKLLSFAG
ncbi:hypothetical protein VNO80_27613 [Phaseolus coccineus]|uniref:Uncharacterized protein n=1 Tax=Phaseolus coccineus TaxID=3886 RepID=A0AAN9LGW9_PHACN